jgi:hypothetical protein
MLIDWHRKGENCAGGHVKAWLTADPSVYSEADAYMQMCSTLRTANEFLRKRADTAKPKDLMKYIRRAAELPPEIADERA